MKGQEDNKNRSSLWPLKVVSCHSAVHGTRQCMVLSSARYEHYALSSAQYEAYCPVVQSPR